MSFLTDVVIMELVLDRQPPPCCCLIIRPQNTGLGDKRVAARGCGMRGIVEAGSTDDDGSF